MMYIIERRMKIKYNMINLVLWGEILTYFLGELKDNKLSKLRRLDGKNFSPEKSQKLRVEVCEFPCLTNSVHMVVHDEQPPTVKRKKEKKVEEELILLD